MRCPLWVQFRINVLHSNRILITDTSWLVRKGDTWGVPFEFKIWLIYYISKEFSQQSPHSSSVRAIHGVSPVGSNSDWCITSLHDPHSIQPMARPWGQYITVILFWVIYVKAWRLVRAEWYEDLTVISHPHHFVVVKLTNFSWLWSMWRM